MLQNYWSTNNQERWLALGEENWKLFKNLSLDHQVNCDLKENAMADKHVFLTDEEEKDRLATGLHILGPIVDVDVDLLYNSTQFKVFHCGDSSLATNWEDPIVSRKSIYNIEYRVIHKKEWVFFQTVGTLTRLRGCQKVRGEWGRG